MSFMDAREHGSKPGSGGAASAQNEVDQVIWISPQPGAVTGKVLAGVDAYGVKGRPHKSNCLLQAIDRRERLRRLALETIDLTKDPYFMRNHLGQVCCCRARWVLERGDCV